AEIIITGRTKHFLSLCGEHLSVDNMNKSVELVSNELGITVREFTVAGLTFDREFGHHWYIGTDDPVDADLLRQRIDQTLCELNDDYAVERKHALKKLELSVVPTKTFYNWMETKGKLGGQNKFPRVLKKALVADWQGFLEKQSQQMAG
ncbi:MAG: GH3 auxin-responsive promoter family protein, partial [Rudanella sp.]|nr:GH3 auxin-responsive promoter family protein [Rudanella sp.]